MRKLIDINEKDGTYEKLQILAIKAKKDLKNYIQDILSEHARVGGKKQYCYQRIADKISCD